MPRFFLFILTLLFSLHINGQAQKIKIKKEEEKKPKNKQEIRDSMQRTRRTCATIDLFYGYKAFSPSLYKQLDPTNKIDLSQPLKIIGFGVSDYRIALDPRKQITLQMFYSYYLNSTINIQDTLSAQMTGFTYHFGIGKLFKTRMSKYSLGIFVGFNTGRVKLKYADGFKQKNGFFSPKISLQPKIMLTRKIAFSVIFDYEYDVSKTRWQNLNNKNSFSILNLNQSGLVGLVSIGYAL